MIKRKANESYPNYVDRVFSHLSDEDKKKIKTVIKEAWFDGLRFERNNKKL